jgi:A/G-specific adenine glycosylase
MGRQFHIAPATVNAFQQKLRRWYRVHQRDLPWRRTHDPYRIWVSEIMLQQTRVEVVRDYYRRWLREFPTVRALARARVGRVLKLWEGLGYYHRARNLHRAAKLLAGRARCPSAPRTAGTAVPTNVAELMELPGIGRYTAGAIASIAFDQPAPLVDGNVARVFGRLFPGRDPWSVAAALLPVRAPGEFNQALMELGALVCTPRNPRCADCPVRKLCPGPTPQPRRRAPLQPVTQCVALVRRAGRVLLRQRPPTGSLAGLWELPSFEPPKSNRKLLTLQHTITNHRITLHVYAGSSQPVAGRWFTRRQAARLAMPAAHRRVLTAASGSDSPSRRRVSPTRR